MSLDYRTVTEGGLYGINLEVLGANKTLTPGIDKMYQYLDEGGANRDIVLATAGARAGDRFVIRHNGVHTDTNSLSVKQGITLLSTVWAGGIVAHVFDGTNWIAAREGSGEVDDKKTTTALGTNARGSTSGTAFGCDANGYSRGVALGRATDANTYGVAVGYNAVGSSHGVGIGNAASAVGYNVAIGDYANTNAKKWSIAIGQYSETERVAETAINIDGGDSDQENNVTQGRWCKETADAVPIEMFLGEEANQRFTIRASSVLAFRMTIVARDNVAGHVAMYTIDDGLIKRDAANNTVLVTCTVVVVHEDDAAWDVVITADDANEALIITVTGDDTNPTQWAAVMDGVETHF